MMGTGNDAGKRGVGGICKKTRFLIPSKVKGNEFTDSKESGRPRKKTAERNHQPTLEATEAFGEAGGGKKRGLGEDGSPRPQRELSHIRRKGDGGGEKHSMKKPPPFDVKKRLAGGVGQASRKGD